MVYFATAAKGTEPLLRDELRELRVPRVRADRGGVHFEGQPRDAWRACLWSRIALRILEEVARFPCASEQALYEGVAGVDWARWLTPRHSVLIAAACRSSRLTHSQYISQLTKDAIVDQQRERLGARSNVEREDPDLRVFVHLVRDEATLYVDVSGQSLHRRGYRSAAFAAPLRENLAAAVVRASGWSPETPLVDPTCGSGTLLIEGALAALGRAPGLGLGRFGFERWSSHDDAERRAMAELREEARAASLTRAPRCIGVDRDPTALAAARDNARRAGVHLELRRGSLSQLQPPAATGALVCNPPYGERLERDGGLARELAGLIERFSGFQQAFIVPSGARLGSRRPDQKLHVSNGDLPAELQVFHALSGAGRRG